MKKTRKTCNIIVPVALALTGILTLIMSIHNTVQNNVFANSTALFTWSTETLDTTIADGFARLTDISMAIDEENEIHISYYDSYDGLYGELKYIRYSTSGWISETVDQEGGGFTSIALDSAGNPHISYYIFGPTGNLKYASWNGSSWISETVSQIGGPYGSGFNMAVAVDTTDNPHIATTSFIGHDSLEYFHWTGSAWTTTTVDNEQGRYPSSALDDSNNAHMSYHDLTNNLLKYAQWTGRKWITETVAASGIQTSLALDDMGYPYIAYFDTSSSHLKCAHWTGSNWDIKIVDSEDKPGWIIYPSIVIDSNNKPHIAYHSSEGIEYAYWTGSEWVSEIVNANLGTNPSLVLDDKDRPYIAYEVYQTGELRLAQGTRAQKSIYLPFVLN